ncbi:hypothetical protein B566_EDAN005959 [Ephemera danica]|nr:hypothetical protein B566_EDAN005959 [Ephemera danica]
MCILSSGRGFKSTTGLIHMALEEEHPMFSKLKINVLPPRSCVVKLVVINDTMLAALSSGTLLRIDLRSADKVEELELGKPMASPMRVVSLFMDPHGYHALVSLASKHGDAQPELLYVPCRSTKLRASNRARGYEITAVGWNHNADTEASTGPILLGTSKDMH